MIPRHSARAAHRAHCRRRAEHSQRARRLFRRESIRLPTAASALEALGRLEQTPVDLVITDERTPDMDGGTFLQHVRKHLGLSPAAAASGQHELFPGANPEPQLD